MDICSNKHDEIVVDNGRFCPLCDALDKIGELENTISQLEDEIASLNEKLSNLESEI